MDPESAARTMAVGNRVAAKVFCNTEVDRCRAPDMTMDNSILGMCPKESVPPLFIGKMIGPCVLGIADDLSPKRRNLIIIVTVFRRSYREIKLDLFTVYCPV